LNDYATHLLPEESGYKITQMGLEPLEYYMSPDLINPEIIEYFATNQQVH